MAPPTPPQVHLQLPEGPDREALRAGLLALRCIPVNLPAPGPDWVNTLQALAQQPNALVFFDISNPLPRIHHRFETLLAHWPAALRGRTVLTRLAAGHVAQADRAWVRAHGFNDLLGSLTPAGPTAPLRRVLDLVAGAHCLPPLPEAERQRYLSAVGPAARAPTPRTTILAHTGLGAEAMAEWLQASLDIRDRQHHFKTYPACWVGAEAVTLVADRFRLTRTAALAVGQALAALDLLHHVVHEHGFEDAALFYRLRAPAQLARRRLGTELQWLRAHLSVQDRRYRATVYPACWVGEEAVSLLSRHRALSRHDSLLLLHRLMQFGCLEHVCQEHGVVDGPFFYRFAPAAA